MLSRQKVLIELLRQSGGEADRMLITKLAFLLRYSTDSHGGASFYDFVPYDYGPFSFAMYQEAGKLVTQGYLSEPKSSRWALGDVAGPLLDHDLQADVAAVTTSFASEPLSQVVDHVYHRFPQFTVNSKRIKLQPRATASEMIYTAGYEGKSIDSFLNGLVETGIRRVVDVRMNPIARRYGFHRSTLSRLCGYLDIQYEHVPSLGIPSQLRQNLVTSEDYQQLFERYEQTTLTTESDSIRRVCNWFVEMPSVLVCMEANPSCCHRQRLAVPISQRTRLPIVHLS